MSRSAWRHSIQALVWLGYAAVNAALMADTFGLGPGVLLIIGLLSLGLWGASELLRALARRRAWLERSVPALVARLGGVILVLALAIQVGIYLILRLVGRVVALGLPSQGYSPGVFVVYVFNTAILLTLWSAVWAGIQYLRRARDAQVRHWQAEAERRRLELDALKARLNPHFMFNALNNLRALINEDTELAREAVTRLSNTLRYALYHSQKERVSLAEEWAVVSDYLALESLHYENRLRVESHMLDALLSRPVPPMLLQLLVENAIKHGIALAPGGGVLRLRAEAEGAGLRLVVENPGSLAGRDTGGVGLAFLRTRLAETLPGARFELTEQAGCVRATLVLPGADAAALAAPAPAPVPPARTLDLPA